MNGGFLRNIEEHGKFGVQVHRTALTRAENIGTGDLVTILKKILLRVQMENCVRF